jgi:hypothetical protein
VKGSRFMVLLQFQMLSLHESGGFCSAMLPAAPISCCMRFLYPSHLRTLDSDVNPAPYCRMAMTPHPNPDPTQSCSSEAAAANQEMRQCCLSHYLAANGTCGLHWEGCWQAEALYTPCNTLAAICTIILCCISRLQCEFMTVATV